MENEKLIKLMNNALDNSITKEEQIELENLLCDNPKAAQDFAELKRSSQIIRNLPEYEPSINIKKNILNAINKSLMDNKKMNEQTKSSWIKTLFPFKPKIAFSLAFSLVIGFCVFLLWYTSDKNAVGNESVSGTMGKVESIIDASSSYYTDIIGIKSSLNIYQRKDTLMVLMHKKSEQDISVGYHFEPDFLTFIGVKENKSTSPLIQKVNGNASVTIQDSSKVLMMFHILKPASAMDLQIRDDSRQIFRYKFTVGQKSK